MIDEIFKIPLYKTTLSLDTKSIKSYCISLSKKSNGVVHTNQGGWQSEHLTFSERPLIPLYNSILHHGNLFLKELKFNGELRRDNVWININGYRDSNVLHKHDHSFISGVYYVNVPKDSGKIVFHRPGYDTFTPQWNKFPSVYNNYNSAVWNIPPSLNTLLLFPCWLNHMVDSNMNKKEKRISISFNLSLKAI